MAEEPGGLMSLNCRWTVAVRLALSNWRERQRTDLSSSPPPPRTTTTSASGVLSFRRRVVCSDGSIEMPLHPSLLPISSPDRSHSGEHTQRKDGTSTSFRSHPVQFLPRPSPTAISYNIPPHSKPPNLVDTCGIYPTPPQFPDTLSSVPKMNFNPHLVA